VAGFVMNVVVVVVICSLVTGSVNPVVVSEIVDE
jgi:hypothetical protein